MTRGLLLGCVAAAVISVVSSFTDITDAVFGSAKASVLSAFGDFNSDKLTDLFIVSSDFHNLEVWIATGAKPSFEKSDVKCSVPGTITSVMPGDFDGDSIMDVLVTSTTDAAGKGDLNVHVFWGRLRMGVDCATNGTSLVVTHQPLLFDFNSDRVVDILSALSSTPSVRTVWSFGRNKTVSTSSLGVGVGPLAKPHSNSYVDLNDDMTADLMLTAEASMELWFWVGNGTFSGPHRRDYPEGASVRGQSLFVDIDADGDMEHLMPVCVGNADCSSSAIMVFNGSVWIKWFDDFRDVSNQTWHFRRSNEHPGIDVPITLRTADVDMDGYPDILAVLEGKPKGQKKTVSRATLLLNIACPSCPYGRRLVPFWNYGGLADFDAVRLAAFFDIDEDGQMDVLLVNGTRTATGLRTHALRNQFSDDACFIKVLAVSGLCYSDCPSGQIAYGTNQPGPFVRYRIIKSDGYPQESCTSQLYQSAHFSLQLPYTVFGLGQSPNFVDVLTVAYPSNTSAEHPSVHHQWTQIIPNSQMVIIPYPPDQPSRWVNKLFVTPGRQVLLTFIALAGTCVFISLIIAAFHWLEKREDHRVKLQEAHQFHFDAM